MAEPRPTTVVHADLADGLPSLPAHDGRGTDLYLWHRGTPLGHVQLGAQHLPERALADRIGAAVAWAVSDRMFGLVAGDSTAGLPEPLDAPEPARLLALERPLSTLEARSSAVDLSVTVVICTRDRPDALERCLDSLGRSERGWLEVLVVDNGPSLSTRRVTETHSAQPRYVVAQRPGQCVARNVGLAAARGDIVAFVDDDTEVDPRWLAALREPFGDPGIASVTGLVLPAALDTPAQAVFEKVLGGFARGFRVLDFDPAFLARTRAHGSPVWKIGAGANMAVRRSTALALGGFDERLGPGAAGCSDDSEFWYRLLGAGWTCRYEPSSVVYHHHRSDYAALDRQARAYISGHMAALFVQFARHRHVGNLRRALFDLPRHFARQAVREGALRALDRAGVEPGGSGRPLRAEFRGYLDGLTYAPLALARERTAGKRRLGDFLRLNPYPHPYTAGFFYREKMRAIHRVAPDAPMERVLEVGGGRSGLASLLYPGAEVVTADLDPAYAESPVHRRPRASFVVADATALPFDDASFDAVTLFDVLEHIPDDAAAAREALRVVRPGGWILVSTPNERWRSPYHRTMRPICLSDEEMMRQWGHVRRGYRLAELETLFGGPAALRGDFITPVTVIGQDLAFSRLPERLALALNALVSPLTWAGYLAQPASARGIEVAAAWQRRRP